MTWRVEQRDGDEGPWDVTLIPLGVFAVGLGVDAAHDVAREVRQRRLRARIMEEPEPITCRSCDGLGEWTVAACCGNLTRVGDCCGEPVPERQQCGVCCGTGVQVGW